MRILITGANRGLGYELTQQYLSEDGATVFAACRQPENADQLHALEEKFPERLQLIPMDVAEEGSIIGSAALVREQTDALDVLINNAGILGGETARKFGELQMDDMAQLWRTNTAGPVIITQAYVELLKKGDNPRLIMISSDAGSVGIADYGGDFGYGPSKAALNRVTRSIAAKLKDDGIITVAIHPGWVRTDMGGQKADLSPEESAQGVRSVIAGASADDNNKFYTWEGEEFAW